MSLVNDMLRDLAERQQQPDFVAAEQETLLQQSSLLRKTRHNWLPSVIVFFAVILMAVAVQIFLQKKNEQPVQQVDMPQATPVDHAVVMPQVAHAQEVVPVVEPDEKNSTVTESVPEPEQQERIYRLLQQAERALTLDRLTAPIEDNAYLYYEEILALAPGNVMAIEGMQRIADRYIKLADEAKRRGETDRVDQLLQRAETVAPDYAAINIARENFRTAPAKLVEAETVTGLETELVSVPVETLTVTEAGGNAIDITPNPVWQDQQMVAQADVLISQGHADAAALALQQFVAQHPKPVKSAARLFELYVQQTQFESARLLLQQMRHYLPAVDFTRFTAQLLTAQGQHAAALKVLEKDVELAQQDEVYRALLAALYHKTARYQESAAHYRRLLENFGEKPGYWLGLALALDALQQPASALEAYRRVGLQGAQPQVKDYVAQRIAALSH